MDYKIIGEKADFKEPKPWVFRPVLALRLKLMIVFTISIIITYLILAMISAIFRIKERINDEFLINILFITALLFIVILIIGFIAISMYYSSFEYQVHGTEIIVKKGLFNKTENHIPFSNITNIAIRVGPLDQLIGIGSILVYTAGQTANPFRVLSLAGLKIYQDVCYFILNQIKDFETYLNFLTNEGPKGTNFTTEYWRDFHSIVKEIHDVIR